jgi:uncharacterized coiled-coil protein SlyX
MTNKVLTLLEMNQELAHTKAALSKEQQKVAELKVELVKAMPAELAAPVPGETDEQGYTYYLPPDGTLSPDQLCLWANDLMIREARARDLAAQLSAWFLDMGRWHESLDALAKSLDEYRKSLDEGAAKIAYELQQVTDPPTLH